MLPKSRNKEAKKNFDISLMSIIMSFHQENLIFFGVFWIYYMKDAKSSILQSPTASLRPLISFLKLFNKVICFKSDDKAKINCLQPKSFDLSLISTIILVSIYWV